MREVSYDEVIKMKKGTKVEYRTSAKRRGKAVFQGVVLNTKKVSKSRVGVIKLYDGLVDIGLVNITKDMATSTGVFVHETGVINA